MRRGEEGAGPGSGAVATGKAWGHCLGGVFGAGPLIRGRGLKGETQEGGGGQAVQG